MLIKVVLLIFAFTVTTVNSIDDRIRVPRKSVYITTGGDETLATVRLKLEPYRAFSSGRWSFLDADNRSISIDFEEKTNFCPIISIEFLKELLITLQIY